MPELEKHYAARHGGTTPPEDATRKDLIIEVMAAAYPAIKMEDLTYVYGPLEEEEVREEQLETPNYTIDRIDLRILMLDPGSMHVEGAATGKSEHIESVLSYYAEMVKKIAGDEVPSELVDAATFNVARTPAGTTNLKFTASGKPADVAKYLQDLSQSPLY